MLKILKRVVFDQKLDKRDLAAREERCCARDEQSQQRVQCRTYPLTHFLNTAGRSDGASMLGFIVWYPPLGSVIERSSIPNGYMRPPLMCSRATPMLYKSCHTMRKISYLPKSPPINHCRLHAPKCNYIPGHRGTTVKSLDLVELRQKEM